MFCTKLHTLCSCKSCYEHWIWWKYLGILQSVKLSIFDLSYPAQTFKNNPSEAHSFTSTEIASRLPYIPEELRGLTLPKRPIQTVHTTRMNNGLFVFGEKFCLCCAAYLQGSPSRMHSARQCSKDANFGLLPPFGQKLVYVLPLREVRKHNQWIPNLAVRFSLGMFSEHPLSSPEAKHAARAGNTGLACWFWVFGKRFVWDYRKTNSLKPLIKIKFPRILHCCATTILELANLAFPLKRRKSQKLTWSAHVVSNFGATLVVSVSRVLLPSRTLKKSVKNVTFVLRNPK